MIRLLLALLLISAAMGACAPAGTPSPVGRYRLDRQHLRENVLVHEDGTRRRRNLLIDAARRGLILEIKEDGSWLLTERGADEHTPVDKGSWALEDATLILDYTLERGLPNSRRVRGSFQGDVIEYKPDAAMAGSFRFARMRESAR